MMTAQTPTPPKRGRPPKPEAERLVPHTIRLTPAESAKLRKLGRDWIAPRLAKVQPK